MNKGFPRSRFGQLYLGAVILAGSSIAILSAREVYARDVWNDWVVLAALTLLTGSFTVKIPGLLARISVSDAFVFASVLVFGPSVATVIVAIDSIVATLWMRPEHRSLLRSLFNLASVALSIWIASQVFFWLANATPGQVLALSQLVGPLFALAALYFLINSWLVAFALSFEKDASVIALWWDNFPWLSLNYFGGVSVAALLVSHTRSVDINTVGIILPLLIITYLTYRTSLARLADAQRHIAQVNDLYLSTIETLAMAVDAKDQITHGHIRRVQTFAVELAARLGVREGSQLRAIETAALLHDMGKLAIPERILNKPGKLTTAEFDTMKRHADIGADLLSSIRFPYPVVPIVRHHHESWNGTGYPSGISGTDIPLGARILSVVDCFDALTSDRPYRPRLTNDEAFSILRDRSGVMYDPLIVDVFINAFDEIAPAAIRAGQLAKSVATFHNDEPRVGHGPSHRDATRVGPLSAALAASRNGLTESDSVEAAIVAAFALVRQFTPASVCVWFEYQQERDSYRCARVFGDSSQLLRGLTIRNGERVTGWAAANRQTAANSDAVLDLGPLAELFSPTLRSAVSCPVTVANEAAGVLTVYSEREEGFAAAHVHALEHISESLALRLKSRGTSKVLI
ncbi:MAG TPA: HD domain-containing phosphohydrolase [Vicinamibacterales bacterium]|nr:HD domain-containing phosphohydrolase [Vicinamibacterales bacterium]